MKYFLINTFANIKIKIMASDAVSINRVSRIIGYKLEKGDFRTTSPNLPIKIAIFSEANTANQADLDLTPRQIRTAQDAGKYYGYGSPIHILARILFLRDTGGVGSIPVVVYPQAEPVGATAKIMTLTPTGVATKNGTHYVVLAGRDGIDGLSYAINVEVGDTTDTLSAKIADAINAVIAAPCSVTDTDYEATFTSKWKGLTANDISLSVDTGDDDLGLTYSVNVTQAGFGTPTVTDALDLIGNEWIPFIINGYGVHSATMDAFESWNGRPETSPTGRYRGIIMKPSVVITGSISEDISATTDTRLDDLTIAIAPAPLSPGLSLEAAANMCVLEAINAQNTPHLDVSGKSYPDMPAPSDGNIGAMSDYDNRDTIVQKGCSTVDFIAGKYQVQDFVTTYHKLGENPPQFRYVRNLILDFNVRYGYYLLEQINVVDHAIANDSDTVSVPGVVKPKMWKQILNGYSKDLESRSLIVDKAFMQDSIQCGLSESNPDRLETTFSYKRSGFVRIASTTATAGFNFGTLTA